MKLFKILALVALIAVQTTATDLFAAPKKDHTTKIKKEKKAKNNSKKEKTHRSKKTGKCCPCPNSKAGALRVRSITQTPDLGL